MTIKWRNIKDNDALSIGTLLKGIDYKKTEGCFAVITKNYSGVCDIKIITPKREEIIEDLSFWEKNYWHHDLIDFWQVLEE